jgi:RimJ/RimL family protein N-acetyltransferase
MLPGTIDGGRLSLRPFRADDAEAVFSYASDEQFLRYLPIATPYTQADTRDFLAKQAALDRELNPSWALDIGGVACGGINIRFFAEHRVAEIGYGVARRLWGQGLATAAARLVIAAAFGCYAGLSRVRAKADARNVASVRVMEKLGMRREGLMRSDRLCRGELTDEVVYGLLRSEWRA